MGRATSPFFCAFSMDVESAPEDESLSSNARTGNERKSILCKCDLAWRESANRKPWEPMICLPSIYPVYYRIRKSDVP